MIRWLNVIAVAALVGSAAYAYSIKYETARYAAEIIRTQHAIAKEKDGISMLKADYAWLSRPGRVQSLAEKHLEMQSFSLDLIARVNELPDRAGKGDLIGKKLEALGIFDITTPRDERAAPRTATPPVRR